MAKGLLIALLLFLGYRINAQDSLYVSSDSTTVITDSTFQEAATDTVLLKSYASRYDPRKALLYSAVFPGAGQIYNKKYWKLPLVYGGLFGFAYGVNFYQEGYTKYKNHLYYNLENGAPNDGDIADGDETGYTTGTYRKLVDQYKRQRDFMMILLAGMYLLQIIDAHVDAHLKEFDVNPNLQVSVKPVMEQTAMLGNQKGFTIVIKF